MAEPTEQLAKRLEAGTLIAGRYRLVRYVASGGMGDVYEAEDLEIGQRIAVKTVKAWLAESSSIMARVRREVQLARTVTDAHVCRIFDIGNWEGITFITMEYLEGETLLSRVKQRGPMQPDDALPLALDLLAGLEACHGANVIHRDLKAENILLVRRKGIEHAILMDFGIARHEHPSDGSVTQDGTIVGSPAFMAPELSDGQPATVQSDIYSAGAVLWELFVGEWPLRGKSSLEIMKQLASRPMADRLPATLDGRWADTIRKCLARAPHERWESAGAAAHALVPPGVLIRRTSSPSIAKGVVDTALTVATPRRRSRRRQRVVLAVSIATVLAGAGAVIALTRGDARQPGMEARPAARPGFGGAGVATTVATRAEVQRLCIRAEYGQALAAIGQTSDPAMLVLVAEAHAGRSDYRALDATVKQLRGLGKLPRKIDLQTEIFERMLAFDYAGTLPLHDAIHTTHAGDPHVAIAYAEALARMNKVEDAKRVLASIETTDPDVRARILFGLADRLDPNDVDHAELERTAREALAAAGLSQPLEARTRRIHGIALATLGRPEEAVATLRMSVEIADRADDPVGSVRCRHLLAYVLSGTPDPDALRVANEGVERAEAIGDPLYRATALRMRADARIVVKGEIAGAIDDSVAALELYSKSSRPDMFARALASQYWMLVMVGRMNEAVAIRTRITDITPDLEDVTVFANDALRLLAQGDLSGAERATDHGIAIARQRSDNTTLASLLAVRLSVAAENADDATFARLLAEAHALQKATGDGEAAGTIAIAQAKRDPSHDATVASLQEALGHGGLVASDVATVHALLARGLARRNKHVEARAQLERWRATPTRVETSESLLQGTIAELELATTDEDRDRLAGELERVAAEAGRLGNLRARWEAELAIARERRMLGRPAAELAARISQDARGRKFTRLASEAAKIR